MVEWGVLSGRVAWRSQTLGRRGRGGIFRAARDRESHSK